MGILVTFTAPLHGSEEWSNLLFTFASNGLSYSDIGEPGLTAMIDVFMTVAHKTAGDFLKVQFSDENEPLAALFVLYGTKWDRQLVSNVYDVLLLEGKKWTLLFPDIANNDHNLPVEIRKLILDKKGLVGVRALPFAIRTLARHLTVNE